MNTQEIMRILGPKPHCDQLPQPVSDLPAPQADPTPATPQPDPFAPYLTRQNCIRTIANCGDPMRAEASIEFLEKLLPEDQHTQLRDDIEAQRTANARRRRRNTFGSQQINVNGDLVFDKHVDQSGGLALPFITINCD